ncbi:MAG: hypothetical protein V2A73_21480 [Pseudomonadota bacterium]
MTDVVSDVSSTQHPTHSHPDCEAGNLPARRWVRAQSWIYLAVTLGVLAFLLWPSSKRSTEPAQSASVHDAPPVRLAKPGHIQIEASSPLHNKLEVTSVKPEQVTAPVLTVTGTVMASLRPGNGGGKDWQFNSPELLTTYTDWQKAVADIAFTKSQLDSIRQLADNRVAAQKEVVERLEKLVEAGTETERDLATARTELLQAQIEGRKDLHEAETAWRVAQRTEAALSRQLQQAGVEPDVLRVTSAEI